MRTKPTYDTRRGKPRAVPATLQQRCFRRDHYMCVQCGHQSRRNSGELAADHIIPWALGGEDTLDNLQTLCTPCHALRTRAQAAARRQARADQRNYGAHKAHQAAQRRHRHPSDTLGTPHISLGHGTLWQPASTPRGATPDARSGR